MDNIFKKLLDDIKCGRAQGVIFTDNDLAKVKSCLPPPVAPPPSSLNVEVKEEPSCINDGIEEVKKIMAEQLAKQPIVIELGTVLGKLQEAQDHYRIILSHHKERYGFFNDTITTLAPFTSEFTYWDIEAKRLKLKETQLFNDYANSRTSISFIVDIFKIAVDLSDANFLKLDKGDISIIPQAVQLTLSSLLSLGVYREYSITRKARIEAEKSREVSKQGATKALTQRIQNIPSLGLGTAVQSQLNEAVSRISGQLIPTFVDLERPQLDGSIPPARTTVFSIRLIDLDSTRITVPQIKPDGSSEQIEKTIDIRTNSYLSKKVFSKTLSTVCFGVAYESGPVSETKYDSIPGALYNNTNGYAGLYTKLSNPVQYLYTPEERGLSVDPNLIDPTIKDVENAPISITENGTTFYIKSQDQYSKFYETANRTLPDKIKRERDQVFPAAIAPSLETLKTIARSEVADFFRKTTDLPIKLARPLNYKAVGSSIYQAGEFTFSTLDKVVSEKLAYYTKAADEVEQRIKDIQAEIDNLNKLIKENSMDADILTSKISQVACFKQAMALKSTAKDCENETLAKLGTDPLMIRTLGGTDATLPDMNNPCYWKQFANSLNKLGILPIPDITSPLFRYYPVNNIIPTPFGIVLIPTPQKWITLFSLSSSLGTLVTFLTIPAIIVGIPLPSVYMLYLSPDGNKYMLLAPNIPLVFIPGASKYGFEVDTTGEATDPTGISSTNPFKGQLIKGSLSVPISIAARSSRATRLAAVAADLAQGKNPSIKSPDGRVIKEVDPQFYLSEYLGTFEQSVSALDSGAAQKFDEITKKFKKDLNKQFNMLGDMQITAVTRLKEKTRSTRQKSVVSAEDEADPKARLQAKDAARKLDPVQLTEKIQSVLSDFEQYIDKVNFGTIKFPDDPTRLNPKLPGAVSALQPLLEKASRGELAPDLKGRDLRSQIKKFASQVDVSKIKLSKKSFDLSKKEDVAEFKRGLKKFSNESLDHLQGNKTFGEEIDPNLPEKDKAEIAKAIEKRKARRKAAFALSSFSLALPTLKLFDPSAPCCATNPNELPTLASPQLIAAVAVFNALLDAVLSGMTVDTFKSMLGDSVSNITADFIPTLFNSILESIPAVSIPDVPSTAAILQTLIIPVLIALHIPQAPLPVGPVYPFQITIPINAIVKPLLKAAVAYLLELILRLLSDASGLLQFNGLSLESPTIQEIIKQVPCGDSQFATVSTTNISRTVTVKLPNGIVLTLPKIPNIPLDIVSYFALLTSSDLVELIRSLIFAALDGILQPLRDIVVPILTIAQTFKDLSLNIIEAANPFILPIKTIILAIQLQIPNSAKIQLANLDAINAIRAAYIPVITATEPVVKEVAYLVAILAAAFASKPGVKIARIAANPFVNQDDLPPWERLTHKNPLFALFLDEIAWRSSLTSTGSLIFRTKLPGLFPSAYTPNVNSDPGIH